MNMKFFSLICLSVFSMLSAAEKPTSSEFWIELQTTMPYNMAYFGFNVPATSGNKSYLYPNIPNSAIYYNMYKPYQQKTGYMIKLQAAEIKGWDGTIITQFESGPKLTEKIPAKYLTGGKYIKIMFNKKENPASPDYPTYQTLFQEVV